MCANASNCLFLSVFLFALLSLCYHVTRICVFFLFFCDMRVLGRVFVCVRLGAQYPSSSLWSLRGSFPPAVPPVSVLLGGPRATMTAEPSRFAHQTPSDRLPHLKSGSHFLSQDRSELDSLVQFSWVKLVCSQKLMRAELSLINDSWVTTFHSACCTSGSHLSVC